MKKLLLVAVCALVAVASVGRAFCQEGPDMWEKWADKVGLYSPHVNNCDSSTEVFISIGAGDLGFCMEKDKRAADYWENARQTCASVGKRLPEIGEYTYACWNPPTGLIHMTGYSEYVGNRVHYVDISGIPSAGAFAMGSSSGGNACNALSINFLARNTSLQHDQAVFRCVH